MKFENQLVHGTFMKRYKRFFVDATLDNGDVVTAHCANTGSMKGLMAEGNSVWLSHVDDPKRKLKYTLQMIDVGTSLVGVNTSLPNKLVEEAIIDGTITELQGYENLKREVKYGVEGKSRIDILLTDPNKPDCYVEVKNTTLRGEKGAEFPDAVTSRGAKHLEELAAEVEKGNRAVMVFLTQRSDCDTFNPAYEIDPHYCELLSKVAKAGVEVVCYACDLDEHEIKASRRLKVEL